MPSELVYQHAGDLFTACMRKYGLTPEEVVGLLGFADVGEMKAGVRPGINTPFRDYDEALDFIEERVTLRSGRILRPAIGHADMAEVLAETAQKAWDALALYKNLEYALWAEVWAILARISGERWPNPFGAVAAVGRRRGGG